MKVVSATREKIVLKPYRKDITQESFIFDLGIIIKYFEKPCGGPGKCPMKHGGDKAEAL